MNPEASTPEQWLAQYREGRTEAGDRLLKRYEPWLKLLARQQLQSRLQGKFDASDVVQQAMMEAVKGFPKFRGRTEAEFMAWLRRILAHTLAHEVRRYAGTQKRAIDQEVSLDQTLAETSQRLGDLVPGPATSPSGKVMKGERQALLAAVLDQLPEDYRDVLVGRHLEGLSHEALAERMGRNPGAVRMLWVRALARLREELDKGSDLTM